MDAIARIVSSLITAYSFLSIEGESGDYGFWE